MAFNDIAWAQGKPNMGGLKDHIYVVPLEEVDFSTPPPLEADGKTISGDITLVALKKWFKIYFTKGTGKLDFGSVGERDGKSFENMAEFHIPGGEVASLAVIDEMLNTPMLALVKDSSGNFAVLGISKNEDDSLNIDFPVYLETATGTTGAAAADKRGTTIVLKAESPHTPLYYTGAIDLDTGS